MAIWEMTRSFAPGDSRLKLLWIEDKAREFSPPNIPELERWFAVTAVDTPEDVSELLRRSSPPADGFDYAAPFVPFDCYLADFRLCDSHALGCDREDHLASGIHSPSAGFLLGLMTALRSPDHPQTVIPYSAWEGEFGAVWKLVSRFCPESVWVLIDESVNKRRVSSFHDVIGVGAREHRQALRRAMEAGLVHIPLAERDRWEALAAAPGHPDGLDARNTLTLVLEQGRRRLLLGSLFWDHRVEDTSGDPRVPASVVREWLASLPSLTPEELEAWELAEYYWALQQSDQSHFIYRVGRRKKQELGFAGDDALLKDTPLHAPWLLEWKRSEHLRGVDSNKVLRLAVLFGLIRRQHDFVTASVRPSEPERALLERVLERCAEVGKERVLEEMLEDPQLYFESLPALANWCRENDARIPRTDLRPSPTDRKNAGWVGNAPSPRGIVLALISGLVEKLQGPWLRLEDPLREFDRSRPPSEEDAVRFLDPFPGTWTPLLSLDKAGKLGKALDRLDPPLDVKALLAGDGSQITGGERRAAETYARELLPSRSDWPRWLQ